MNFNLRYLVENVDRYGKVRIYLRKPGYRKVVIKERPGTPESKKARRTPKGTAGSDLF